MSMYTMELREIIEHYSQFEDLSHNERIAKGREKLFDFKYPFFDADYKNVFETNFIKNFYMREIGFETEGLFKFRLETWLNINMGYYNKLFESELIEFDPLESYNLKTVYHKKNDSMQDETKNRLQNDTKDVTQKDTTNKDFTETDKRTQNDIVDKTQNDKESVDRNDIRDVTKNDDTTTEQTLTNKNKTTDNVNQTNKSNEKNDSTLTSKSDSTNESNTKDNETVKNFNRGLESNNPDSRLSITPNVDGSGVIEYASKINENNDNNKRDLIGENKGKATNKVDDVASDKRTQDVESKTDSENILDANMKNDETVKLNSVLDDRLDSTTNRDLNITGKEQLESDINSNKNGNETVTLNSDTKDTLTSNTNDKATTSINDIEEYIESKVGSIGVKTYSEMINEYRATLLRIEREIFNEMNELFMLVY